MSVNTEPSVLDSSRPAIEDARLDFIADAEAFARRHKDEAAFRYLRSFTHCSDDELAQLMAKIYCDSRPERPGREESLAASALKLLLQPLNFLVSKRLIWRREEIVDFDFEAIDQKCFDLWFGAASARLKGSKRMSPCAGPSWNGVEHLTSTVRPGTLARLFLAPLWVPSLWLLSRATGQNVLAAYRRALSLFAVFDGHFRRYPCRHFVTFVDEQNHPSRYLAFRRNCPGRLVVVQNGERIYHPACAFGLLDDYLVFGPYMKKLCRDARIRARTVTPVGALGLDRQHAGLRKLENAPQRWDVVLIDQGLWPFTDLSKSISDSFEEVFGNFSLLKKNHPELRLAFQLRPYGGPEIRENTVQAARRRFSTDIEILDNDGSGVSYANIARSKLVLCFNSTIGYEAFFVRRGVRTLFVNCAGDPCQILSLDPRFQHYDPAADYGRFEHAVLAALALDLPEPPEAARERMLPPDGRIDERIRAVLAALPPCS